MLVGEVRDGETAELALKASLTGHLVLTTLHTNSAVAALTRLVDMGVEPFLVASSLTAAIAQRLVRRPCAACAAPYVPDEVTLAAARPAAAGPRRTRRRCAASAARECGGTGYRGRTGVYEVLDRRRRDARGAAAGRRPSRPIARAGPRRRAWPRCAPSALDKARRGETTYEEVMRVTHRGLRRRQPVPGLRAQVEPDMVVCPWCAADARPRALHRLRAGAGPGLADLPLVPDAGRGVAPAAGAAAPSG